MAKAFKLGLNSFEIPKEYGGNKVDLATAEVMYEEMGYYDGNFASVMQTTNLALKPILIGGTPEQVQYFSKHILEGKGYAAFALTEPQSGSDASNVKTTAVKDGDEWVINGEKCFITNGGEADIVCVFASTDPTAGTKGISAFMVPTSTPGFSVTKYEDKSGFRTISTCSLKFDNVRVPAANLVGGEAGLGKGFGFAMKTLDKSRACVGALAVGIARRALDEAIAFVKERVTFGAPVSKRQGIQWMIADMATKIEASRQLVSHANDLQSKGLPFSKEAAMANEVQLPSPLWKSAPTPSTDGRQGLHEGRLRGEAVPRHQGLLHLRGHQPDPEDRYLWRCSVRQGPLIYLVFRAWRGKRV